MKIAVCLISAQPIPNVLFLKMLAKTVDTLLFITTKDMEKAPRITSIREASGCKDKPDYKREHQTQYTQYNI